MERFGYSLLVQQKGNDKKVLDIHFNESLVCAPNCPCRFQVLTWIGNTRMCVHETTFNSHKPMLYSKQTLHLSFLRLYQFISLGFHRSSVYLRILSSDIVFTAWNHTLAAFRLIQQHDTSYTWFPSHYPCSMTENFCARMSNFSRFNRKTGDFAP